jgi:hypothetical protein
MLSEVKKRPRETEANALIGREIGTYKAWQSACPGLFEGEREVTRD